MRTIYRSMEFDVFYNSLSNKVKSKIDYALNIISDIKIVNAKLVKKLTKTDFYELRVSVDNEYRVILFTIDNDNFVESEHVILLNGFMKKSTKEYKKHIIKAEQIIKKLSHVNKN